MQRNTELSILIVALVLVLLIAGLAVLTAAHPTVMGLIGDGAPAHYAGVIWGAGPQPLGVIWGG